MHVFGHTDTSLLHEKEASAKGVCLTDPASLSFSLPPVSAAPQAPSRVATANLAVQDGSGVGLGALTVSITWVPTEPAHSGAGLAAHDQDGLPTAPAEKAAPSHGVDSPTTMARRSRRPPPRQDRASKQAPRRSSSGRVSWRRSASEAAGEAAQISESTAARARASPEHMSKFEGFLSKGSLGQDFSLKDLHGEDVPIAEPAPLRHSIDVVSSVPSKLMMLGACPEQQSKWSGANVGILGHVEGSGDLGTRELQAFSGNQPTRRFSDGALTSLGRLAIGEQALASVHTGQAMMHTGQATMHMGEATMQMGQATMQTGQATMHMGQATMNTGQATMHSRSGRPDVPWSACIHRSSLAAARRIKSEANLERLQPKLPVTQAVRQDSGMLQQGPDRRVIGVLSRGVHGSRGIARVGVAGEDFGSGSSHVPIGGSEARACRSASLRASVSEVSGNPLGATQGHWSCERPPLVGEVPVPSTSSRRRSLC